MRWAALATMVALALASAAHARTWHIATDGSGDAPTVQAGLDSAAVGDTVLAESGTHSVGLVFWPYRDGIVLRGGGAGSTILEGNGNDAVVYMTYAVPIDTATVICDLTIANGGDAGILANGASPLIESCTIRNTVSGPGIYLANASAGVIRTCTLISNAGAGVLAHECGAPSEVGYPSSPLRPVIVQGNLIRLNGGIAIPPPAHADRRTYPLGFEISELVGSGGGIFCVQSDAVLGDNEIRENTSSIYSGVGGIYCETSGDSAVVAVISRNLITENTGRTGGVRCVGPNSIVIDNEITENVGDGVLGGGLCAANGATVEGNLVSRNFGGQQGGGILIEGSGNKITGNVICYNSSDQYGGGIAIENGYGENLIRDNYICENTTGQWGGGICCYHDYEIEISFEGNSIVGNVAHGENGIGGAVYLSDANGAFAFTHNTVAENAAGSYASGIYLEEGMLSLAFCNVASNGWAIINEDPIVVPEIQDDWWGQSSGPWHPTNTDGQGDSLSLYAWDFQPWLTEPDTTAPPAPPTGLVVDDIGGSFVSLSWEDSPLADLAGYRVYYEPDTTGHPYESVVDVGNINHCDVHGLEPETQYCFSVTCYDRNGEESWYSVAVTLVTEAFARVEDPIAETQDLMVDRMSPNPFTEQVRIAYALPEVANVEVLICDTNGRIVCSFLKAGQDALVWNGRCDDGSRAAPGLYFVRLEAGGRAVTSKVVLIR